MSNYSNKSILHNRIKRFGEWIAPEKETRERIKRQADEIRSRIVGQAKDDGLEIIKTPYGGSFPSKTGLRRHMRGDLVIEGQDVDIPFVVKKDKETEFEPLIQRFKKYAEKSYPSTKIDITKSSVNMSFTGTKLCYDIVPMFATSEQDKYILMRNNGEQITTSVEKHIEFIKSRTKKTKEMEGVVAFNHMVRFLKWWREHKEQTTNEIITLPSFLINMLAAKALKECGVNSTYPQTLANWFSYLAYIVGQNETIWFDDYYKVPKPDGTKPWNVLDPVMPENNIVKAWSNWQVKELRDWLSQGSEVMNRAIVADMQGRDADSLSNMQELFGNIFSSHCEYISYNE
jgi:Second Messenger Oligonucleotide or Dinucleotide Synthetase domain